MGGRLFIVDSSSTARQIRRFFAIDSGGVARTIKRAFVIDKGGVARQFYASTTSYSGNMSAGSPGTGTIVGFYSGSYGSINPATDSNNYAFSQLTTEEFARGTEVRQTLSISGFAADPTVNYLSELLVNYNGSNLWVWKTNDPSLSYSYASGVATWEWSTSNLTLQFQSGVTYGIQLL